MELRKPKTRQELIAGLLIALNAAFLGWQVQYFSLYGQQLPHYRVGNTIFCTAFVIEIIVRIRQEKKAYFLGYDRVWNVFDMLIVVISILEELAEAFALESSVVRQVSVLRTIRLFRLARAVRVLRILSFFSEFRLMACTIEYSLVATFWVLVICSLLLYIVALALTDGARDICAGQLDSQTLCLHVGTIGRSVMSLYQAVSGGTLWGDLLDVLASIGSAYSFFFVAFVSFTVLIMFNIVTATIHHKAVKAVETEREYVIYEQMKRTQEATHQLENIFREIDINNSGAISLDELQLASHDNRMNALLASLKLSTDDLQGLFHLLDRDQLGAILIDDFIAGCLRLRGEAKTSDLVKVQVQCEWIMHNLAEVRGVLADVEEQCCSARAGVAAADALQAAVSTTQAANEAKTAACAVPGTRACAAMHSRTAGARSRCPVVVTKVEERAMSLAELRELHDSIKACCDAEGWTELESGAPLSPASVNLYQCDHHYISPRTALGGAVLHGLQPGSWAQGDAVVQVDLDHPEHSPLAEGVAAGPEKVGTGLCVEVVHRGKFRAAQYGKRFHVMVAGNDLGAPQQVKHPGCVSVYELMAPGPRKPKWYCSHWWGGKVLDLLTCCAEHGHWRLESKSHAGYWICAFANRQHDLSSEIGCDLVSVSFRKALHMAQGLLVVLDPEATPFERIWCSFEIYETLSNKKLLDIVTRPEGGDGAVHLLSDGSLPNEPDIRKSLRERDFPIALLAKGMRAQLEHGRASVEEDRRRILETIERGVPGGPGHSGSRTLAEANAALHACFAHAAWPQAVKRGLVTDFDEQRPGTLSLPSILAQDECLQVFSLSLAHFEELNDSGVLALAKGLPPSLQEVQLSFEGCINLSDEGVEELARRLPPGLLVLQLDFLGCKRLTNRSLQAIAQALPAGLQRLRLDFAMCQEISERGLSCLSDCLPNSVQQFSATFSGTQVNRNFKSVAELRGRWFSITKTLVSV